MKTEIFKYTAKQQRHTKETVAVTVSTDRIGQNVRLEIVRADGNKEIIWVPLSEVTKFLTKGDLEMLAEKAHPDAPDSYVQDSQPDFGANGKYRHTLAETEEME